MQYIFVLQFGLTIGIPSPSTVCAGTDPSPFNLSPKDRVLILAPHPDDEAVGTAGIIQKAVAEKIPLRIVYLTFGENNELAFLVFKKHPILTRKGLLLMGQTRRQETVEAMQSLALS